MNKIVRKLLKNPQLKYNDTLMFKEKAFKVRHKPNEIETIVYKYLNKEKRDGTQIVSTPMNPSIQSFSEYIISNTIKAKANQSSNQLTNQIQQYQPQNQSEHIHQHHEMKEYGNSIHKEIFNQRHTEHQSHDFMNEQIYMNGQQHKNHEMEIVWNGHEMKIVFNDIIPYSMRFPCQFETSFPLQSSNTMYFNYQLYSSDTSRYVPKLEFHT